MKRRLFILMTILFPLAGMSQFGMTPPEETDKLSGAAQLGGITADGQNWQQVGFRMDMPLGKFGVGLDIQMLFDADGKIRTADWDEWEDYLDKVYYVRYGKKNKDPFYAKFGSLDYATIGYGNIVDNYTNMIEYPTYRRWGTELAYKGDKFGVEILLNNYKELAMENAGMMIAGRVSYKPIGKLEIGISAAADFNEYNGLRDTDGDGFPDDIDEFIDDAAWATRRDLHEQRLIESGITDQVAINKYIEAINPELKSDQKIGNLRSTDLFNVQNEPASASLVYSADIGYPLIDGEKIRLDIFSHFTQIQNYGYGFTAPGLRFRFGNFLTLNAEYRRSSKEFVFGYVNSTYDIERAIFTSTNPMTGADLGSMQAFTKQERLAGLNSTFNGYLAGADIKIGKVFFTKIEYQDMVGDDGVHLRTLKGHAGLQGDFIPMIKSLNAYYLQNNVQDFREWKTPSTVMGVIFDYNVGGVTMGIDYRLTFQDRNGDGLIRESAETIKTMSFRTKMTF